MRLQLEKVFASPPERTFAAFVDPERFRHWWGPAGFTVASLELDAAEGADYRITMQPPRGEVFHIRGTFRVIEPPRRLAYTFDYEEPAPDDQETLVTLTFEPAEAGTRLLLDQGPFKTEPRRELHRVGWTETLERLEQFLAQHRAVRELQDGLWHWQAAHPAWAPDQWWPQLVSSYAFDDGARLLLFDPLAVPEEILGLVADREPVVVLTAPWHERDAQSLVERFGAQVFTPPPDTADDLVRKYGIARDQIPEGWHSSDVAWLLAEGGGEAHVYGAGDRLPIDVQAFPGRSHNDLVLWIEGAGALVAGDSLVDFGRGFEVPPEVLQHGVTREQVLEDLRPLLLLPVGLVLPAHGAPKDRSALERALS